MIIGWGSPPFQLALLVLFPSSNSRLISPLKNAYWKKKPKKYSPASFNYAQNELKSNRRI
jgi:hypothetical protein